MNGRLHSKVLENERNREGYVVVLVSDRYAKHTSWLLVSKPMKKAYNTVRIQLKPV